MNDRGIKRKKKRSFLCKAKKYHRKGSVGRGNHIDDETYQYFLRMYEVQKEGFDSQDDKIVFVNNFFEEMKNKEIDYSGNQIGSRLIECLLPDASVETLQRFMNAFDEKLRPLCSDEFASHVLEALIKIAAVKSKSPPKSDASDSADTESHEFFQKWTLKIGKFVLNNLEDFVWNMYANHICRTIFSSLVGGLEASDNPKSTIKTKLSKLNGSEEETFDPVNISLLKEFANRLMLWPQFTELPYEDLTSCFLQILLSALHKAACKSTLKKILNILIDGFMKASSNELQFINPPENEPTEKKGEQSSDIPSVFENKSAVHLFETMISVAPKKIFTQIYAKFCINRLAVLAKTKSTNFIVQRLLRGCQESLEFESMYNELEGQLLEIFAAGHYGVFVTLCQASQRLNTKQGPFLQNLMKIFDCHEPKERQMLIVPLTAYLKTYDSYTKDKEENKNQGLNMQGCLILQSLLAFNKPIQIVNSLFALEQEELKFFFCDNKGSHVAEAFLQSPTIGAKSRDKLMKVLKGSYANLANSKHGSWVFEAIWDIADMKQKINIMEELMANESLLESTEYGRIVANKLFLQSFRKHKEAWIQAQNRDFKKKKLFSDIL